MKIIFYIICTTLLLTSCVEANKNGNNTFTTDDESPYYVLKVIDVTHEGETHQYVKYKNGYSGSLCHWEGCKFCKHNNENDYKDDKRSTH